MYFPWLQGFRVRGTLQLWCPLRIFQGSTVFCCVFPSPCRNGHNPFCSAHAIVYSIALNHKQKMKQFSLRRRVQMASDVRRLALRSDGLIAALPDTGSRCAGACIDLGCTINVSLEGGRRKYGD